MNMDAGLGKALLERFRTKRAIARAAGMEEATVSRLFSGAIALTPRYIQKFQAALKRGQKE